MQNKIIFRPLLAGTLLFTLNAAFFSFQDAYAERGTNQNIQEMSSLEISPPTPLPTSSGTESKSEPSDKKETIVAKKISATDKTPQIQVAILLDTSSSMSGLINQTRTELWSVINAISEAKKYDIRPTFNVALYEYGNDGIRNSNSIRQISSFTSDFDRISEHLFSLTTNGGNEFSGAVIDEAASELVWSKTDDDLKLIFIAGNESFAQGGVPFQEAISKAKNEGIIINTIYCGNRDQGIQEQWNEGAALGNGNFFSIDQNQAIAYIETPYDEAIAQYNLELNETYLPYGAHGHSGAQRQLAQDTNSSGNRAAYISRSLSKSSAYYSNATWDIIDASKEGSFDLDEVADKNLPKVLQGKSKKEKEIIIQTYKEKRELIQKEMAALKVKRQTYLAQQNTASNTLGASMIKTIKKQAAQQGFVL